MNKKIKIIELLNKIANGEEMPKEIKLDNEVFVYIGKWEQYVTEEEKIPLLRRICDYNYSGLNDEVEILEDNTEEIEEIEELRTDEVIDGNWVLRKPTNLEIADKVNELVRRINYIERKINEN